MKSLRISLFSLILIPATAALAGEAPVDAARVFGDPTLLGTGDTLGRLSIATARSEAEIVSVVLDDPHLPSYLRHWIRGSRHYSTGQFSEAASEFDRARESWRHLVASAQPDVAADVFDHARALAALRLDDRGRLRAIVDDPIGLHRSDAVWEALRAVASSKRGERRVGLDAAWERARNFERRHPVFSQRALLYAAVDAKAEAATAWLEYVENLRSSDQRREALQIWDAEEELRAIVEAGGDRPRLVRWLARMARRAEALPVARRGSESSDVEERARCFVLVAEQLYRLRRHEELRAWLRREWPAALDSEERASLDAYPWGVRRREIPAAPEIARGFDTVVEEHAGTKRAIEALWEAAWMWELSDEIETAEDRYLRYATEAPHGPFAKAAAARAVFLAARRSAHETAYERTTRFASILGDSHDRAAALWSARTAAEAAGDAEIAAKLRDQLEAKHGAGPFVVAPPHPMSRIADETSVDALLDEFYRRQRDAFAQLADALGLDAEAHAVNSPLGGIEWLYRHSFQEEGDRRLSAYARKHRANSRIQLDCVRLAWSMGRAEQQARIAWTLWLRENGESDELDRALEMVAYPTPFARDVLRASRDEGVPAGLIYSLMRRESFFDPAVVSHAGAYGLLQLMPDTATRLAGQLGDAAPEPRQLWQPLLNLRYGVRYLRNLLEESENDVYRTLAAYNAGEGNGERWANRRRPGEDPEVMLLLISYNETRAYVYHLLRGWRIYGQYHAALGYPEAAAGL